MLVQTPILRFLFFVLAPTHVHHFGSYSPEAVDDGLDVVVKACTGTSIAIALSSRPRLAVIAIGVTRVLATTLSSFHVEPITPSGG